MNRLGKIAIWGSFDQLSRISNFRDGLAPAATGGTWGYIDTTGKWAIDPQFEWADQFADGLAAVRVAGRMGYIDRRGKFVVNPQYDLAHEFSDGYGTVMNSGRFGIIDAKGRVVFEARFADSLGLFGDGLVAVKTDDGWGFIDTTGKMVISPQFDWAGTFDQGLARVTVLGKDAYVTTAGAFVVDPFPGTTVAAMRKQMAAEAAETTRKIAGCWMGQFGDVSVAQMEIRSDGAVVVKAPGGLGQQRHGQQNWWHEILRGTLNRENLRPDTIGATLSSTNAKKAQSYKATLTLDESKQSLTGAITDLGQGITNRIILEKCLD